MFMFHFRPHRTHGVQRCGLLLEMWCGQCVVCVSVCLLVATVSTVSPTKRMNRSRCRLEYGLGWAQGTMH